MRVVYRGDFDGTVCAAMLLELDMCDELIQVHPQDMQDRKVPIKGDDIICNLPYHPDCHMWFDHHTSEINRADFPSNFDGLARIAPSAARLVYEYFESELSLLGKYEDLVEEIDLYDSAILTLEQVQKPEGAILLAFLLDPRTGLGLKHDFNISNYQWSTQIPELLTMYSVEEILDMPDTQERIQRYQAMEAQASDFYAVNTYLDGNVIVSDLRGKQVPVGNRFLIYTLPTIKMGNISVRISDGKKGEFNMISVGHSIFNRTSKINVAEICQKYGGGGHMGAGACQVLLEDSDRILSEIIEACKE
ncbi:MAG: exopolyphosphatase [Fidelibacterota bacterium]|nr:MAG: exopolyphosphatase [Candidatus Neomarinimicrobiota bacterium]